MTWQNEALCRGRSDITWFPATSGEKGGQPLEYKRAVEAAVAVCRECPVIAQCREAGANEIGIWGGELKRAPRYERTTAPCGTAAAYARHLRRGEPACQPCRFAVTLARRVREERAASETTARLHLMLGRSTG